MTTDHEAQSGSNPRGWAGLAVFLIVLVINISMWVISLKNLKRGYHKAQHDPEDKKQDVLLDRRYIILRWTQKFGQVAK